MQTVHGGPEALFRVTDLVCEPTRATGRMLLGPWSTSMTGRTSLGALGVLADDTLGYAIVAHAPAGSWSVSIEITLDLIAELPGPGAVLWAEATLAGADDAGAVAEGSVLDEHGRLLARTSQRGRWVSLEGLRDPLLEWDAVPRPPADATFADVVREPASVGDVYLLRTDRATGNNMGVVHGGTSIAAAAAVAEEALHEADEPLRITSLRINYPRPTLTGSRVHVSSALVYRGRSLGVVDVTTRADGADRTLTRITAEA